MNFDFLARLFCCIFIFSLFLYIYVDKQNELTELRLQIPLLNKEVREIKELNSKLLYEVEKFESPAHLIELSQKPEFGHLEHPYTDDIIILRKGSSLIIPKEEVIAKIEDEELFAQ